mgnify:CR=1 FL=1
MFEPYNLYNPYNNNPYLNYNQQPQQIPRQPQQQLYKPQGNVILQGKVVDSLDVVKATDIPYDGSVSYFPLIDGTAIITKQLQQDGTSKVVIYKPITENEESKTNYITETDLKKQLKDMDDKYITSDDFKDQIKRVNSKDIKDMKEDIKTLKRKLEDIADDLKYKKEK